jgi:hypothetical protein
MYNAIMEHHQMSTSGYILPNSKKANYEFEQDVYYYDPNDGTIYMPTGDYSNDPRDRYSNDPRDYSNDPRDRYSNDPYDAPRRTPRQVPQQPKDESGFIGDVRTDKLTAIFNEFAGEAVRDFAKLKGSFMLIDGRSGQAIGDIAPGKLSVDASEVAMSIAEEYAHQDRTGGYADTYKLNANSSEAIKNGDLYAIRYNMFMPFSGNAEQDIWFALNHEEGHAVVPGAIDPDNVNFDEMGGDVFSMMQHIKRFGDDTNNNYLTLLARVRSQGLLAGDPTHFTNPALALFAQEKDSLDVKNMTPDQMTAAAADIAKKSEVKGKDLSSLVALRSRAKKRYVSMAQRSGKQGMDVFLFALVQELLQPATTKTEFDMGMQVIQPYLTDVPGHPSLLPINDPKWSQYAQALAQQAKVVKDVPLQTTPVKGLPSAFPNIEDRAHGQPPQRQPAYGSDNPSWDDILNGFFGGRGRENNVIVFPAQVRAPRFSR